MNWKPIIATALMTAIVTLTTGMLLFWWQEKKPALVYNSVTSIPFIESSQSLYIQNIDVENAGNTYLENVVMKIVFSEGTIEKTRIQVDPAITYSKNVDNKSVTLNLPDLNENEHVKISLLLNSAGKEPIDPKISLRAKNVRGEPATDNTNNKYIKYASLGIALFSAYVGLISAVLASRRGRTAFERVFRTLIGMEHNSSQRYVIASALAMCGLPDHAREYVRSSAPRQYWVEADLLAAYALTSDEDETKAAFVRALELIYDVPTIATRSKAIILYDIARIYQSLGDTETALTKLEAAKEIDRREIQTRLDVDPILGEVAKYKAQENA